MPFKVSWYIPFLTLYLITIYFKRVFLRNLFKLSGMPDTMIPLTVIDALLLNKPF